MAPPRTFDNKRAQVLFDQGLGCNAIAREMGVSASSVSAWAKAEGLSFLARARTATAAVVRAFDMQAARTRLAEKMTRNADTVLDSLNRPYLVYSFGGKDNTYEEHELAEAPISARREAQTVAAIAFDKLTKAIEGSDEGNVDARSLLTDLGKALGIGDPTETPLA